MPKGETRQARAARASKLVKAAPPPATAAPSLDDVALAALSGNREALGMVAAPVRGDLKSTLLRAPEQDSALVDLAELALWEGDDELVARSLASAFRVGHRSARASLLDAVLAVVAGDGLRAKEQLRLADAHTAGLPERLRGLRERIETDAPRLGAPPAERCVELGTNLTARARRERVVLGRDPVPPGFGALIKALAARMRMADDRSFLLLTTGGISPYLFLERVVAAADAGVIPALVGRTMVMLPPAPADPRAGRLPLDKPLLPSNPEGMTPRTLSVEELARGSRDGVVWVSAAPFELVNSYGFEWLRRACRRATVILAGATGVMQESVLLRPALAASLETVEVCPTAVADVTQELGSHAADVERALGCTLDDESLSLVPEMADACVPQVPQPWSTWHLLDLAARWARASQRVQVTASDVRVVARDALDVGPSALAVPMSGDGSALSDALGRDLLLSPEVIEDLATELAVTRCVPALRPHPDRPDLALLVLGPPGSGKSTLARSLARVLLGDASRLLSFDLGAMSVQQSLDLLRADPPGAIAGRLSLAPSQVIELSSIHLANPALHGRLAEVLYRGVIESAWRPIRLRRAVFVLTATDKEGADAGIGLVGVGAATSSEMAKLARRLFPETPGLLTTLTVLRLTKMTRETMRMLVKRRVKELAVEPAERRLGVAVLVDEAVEDAVVDLLEKWGLGSDRLAEAVERLVLRPLAAALPARGSLVRLALREGRVEVEVCDGR